MPRSLPQGTQKCKTSDDGSAKKRAGAPSTPARHPRTTSVKRAYRQVVGFKMQRLDCNSLTVIGKKVPGVVKALLGARQRGSFSPKR